MIFIAYTIVQQSSYSLVPLLEANASNLDPGRVINISSVAGLSAQAEMNLAEAGNGTYSCNQLPYLIGLTHLFV